MMDIRCRLCRRLSACTEEEDPDYCSDFGINISELVDLAVDISKEYKIEYTDALNTISIALQFGGCIDD